MSFLKRISISTKIILASMTLAAVFLGSTFSYVVLQTQKQLEATETKILNTEIIAESQTMIAATETARQALFAVSQMPAIQDIIRSSKQQGRNNNVNDAYSASIVLLNDTFRAEINSNPLYDKIRYIDKLGNEIVRVDNIKGVAVSTEKSLLQNKGDRDYFQTANTLSPGQVYVSHAELSREGTPPQISTPHRPVIRYAIPIFSNVTNEHEGVLVISVNIDQLISKSAVDEQVSAHGKDYIINSFKEFMVNPSPDKEWGGVNNLNTGINLDTEFPQLSKYLVGENGSFKYGQSIFAYTKILPDSADKSREWIIMQEVPVDQLFAPVILVARNATVLAVLVFIAFLMAFSLGIKKLFSPLIKLAESAKRIAEGDFSQKIDIQSNDEIGHISQEFNKMRERLAESYGVLEKEVTKRTSELQDVNKTLLQKEEERTKQMEELEKLNKYMIDRELRMVGMKKEMEDLRRRISQ